MYANNVSRDGSDDADSQSAQVMGYPPLPMQFACSGVFPVYSADQMRAYADATCAMRAQEPAGEVVSALCDYATVRWLHQTSSVGGGDPRNSWSWPITGDKVYLAPQSAPEPAHLR